MCIPVPNSFENRFFDLEERTKFCFEKCLGASQAYELELGKKSISFEQREINCVLKLFEEGDKLLLGLGFERSRNLGKEVRIVKKDGGFNGERAIDGRGGTAQVIKGSKIGI